MIFRDFQLPQLNVIRTDMNNNLGEFMFTFLQHFQIGLNVLYSSTSNAGLIMVAGLLETLISHSLTGLSTSRARRESSPAKEKKKWKKKGND